MPSSNQSPYGVRIFISAVTDEFHSYREYLRKNLEAPSVDVKIQEDFVPWGTRTLEKLDEYIRACNAMVHLAGKAEGAVPHWDDVRYISEKYPKLYEVGGPLEDVGEIEKRHISYTQWEAYLAAYHERRLFIAKPTGGMSANQDVHLQRLERAGRYAEIKFADERELLIQLLQSDLRNVVPDRSLAHSRRSRFGEYAIETLKDILLNHSLRLCQEHFIFNVFVQLTGSTLLMQEAQDLRELNDRILDSLSESDQPHHLLMLADFCRARAKVLDLQNSVERLDEWIEKAQSVTGVPDEAVQGACSSAIRILDTESPPAPYLHVTWEDNPADPHERKKVFLRASLHWGRARDNVTAHLRDAIEREQTIAEVIEWIDGHAQYRSLVFNRIELVVPTSDLNYQWEYPPDENPDDEICMFYPWPVVIRLRRRSLQRRSLVQPCNPMDAERIACLGGDSDGFLRDAQVRGAFFVSWLGYDEPDLNILRKAANLAGLGLWLRKAGSSTSVDGILSELSGKNLSSIPQWYYQEKRRADKTSPWRHISLLFDLPDHDQDLGEGHLRDTHDLIHINHALM